jgi:hypothetical protein
MLCPYLMHRRVITACAKRTEVSRSPPSAALARSVAAPSDAGTAAAAAAVASPPTSTAAQRRGQAAPSAASPTNLLTVASSPERRALVTPLDTARPRTFKRRARRGCHARTQQPPRTLHASSRAGRVYWRLRCRGARTTAAAPPAVAARTRGSARRECSRGLTGPAARRRTRRYIVAVSFL